MDSSNQSLLRERVNKIVAAIPHGKVATYGQIALLAGLPRAAREVGWIAHTGPSNLPWQRVVNRFGGLAKGYPGGQLGHKKDLEEEDFIVRADMTVDLNRYQWWPDAAQMKKWQLPPDLVDEINRKIAFSHERLSRRRAV